MKSTRLDALVIVRTMVVVVAVAWAGAAAADSLTEHFDQTYPLSAGGRVALDNVNGDVSIAVWDRDEVRVEAVKVASSAERLQGLKIEVEASNGSVRIDTQYPRSGSSWGDRHGKTEVTYTLTVPRFARIDTVDLVNGDLAVEGVKGGVEAESVNGRIKLREVGGDINLSTVNGAIDASLGALDDIKSVDIESVNGAIEILVAPGAGASVEAETVNGRIRNDLGIEVKKGKYVGSSMRGSFGGGGTDIELETVNGKIEINQG